MTQPTNTRFAVGVHLLTLLGAGSGEWRDSQYLAVSPATDAGHARRILGRLRQGGPVRPQPGPRGGWMLEREAAEIDLSMVWLVLPVEARIARGAQQFGRGSAPCRRPWRAPPSRCRRPGRENSRQARCRASKWAE